MPERADRDELLAALRALADDLDRPPTYRDTSRAGEFSPSTYTKHFGSWSNALEAAGLKRAEADDVDRSELLKELRQIANELGETPTQDDIREKGGYSLEAYLNEFDSFVIALEEADLEPSVTQYRFSDVEPPEDKRATENVRVLKREGPTVIDELPSETSVFDKKHGLWRFSMRGGRDRSDQPDVPQPDTVCYLENEHDPETVIRTFFAANPRLLERFTERTLVDRIRQHRREWKELAEEIVPELLEERGLEEDEELENGLLVVDCTGDDIWRSCAERTVADTVSVSDHLSNVDGERYVWGFPEEYEPLWTQVEAGDVVVLSLESDRYTHAFRITDCVQDWGIGSKLWAEYEDGIRVDGPDQPWIYVLLGTRGIDIDIQVEQLSSDLETDIGTEPVQYVDSDVCRVLRDGDPWTYLTENEDVATRGSKTGESGTERGAICADGSSDTESTPGDNHEGRRGTQKPAADRSTACEQIDSTSDAATDTYAVDVRLAALATDRDAPLFETATRAVREQLKRAIDDDPETSTPSPERTIPVQLDLTDRQRQFLDLIYEDSEHFESRDDFVNDAMHTFLEAPDPEEQSELELTIDATTATALQAVFGTGSDPPETIESVLVERLIEEVTLQGNSGSPGSDH